MHSKEAIDEVGCIHSTQGYDLNYAFIILGNEIGYDSDKKSIIVRAQNYYDQYGKSTASDEELKEYIQHIDRKSTRLNSSHKHRSRMPSSA